MKPNVYLYILVMAGVTYLIRMLPLVLFKREITSPLCKILSVLCAICMSCCYDISGNPDSNGRWNHFRSGFIVALIVAYREKSLLRLRYYVRGVVLL